MIAQYVGCGFQRARTNLQLHGPQIITYSYQFHRNFTEKLTTSTTTIMREREKERERREHLQNNNKMPSKSTLLNEFQLTLEKSSNSDCSLTIQSVS